MFRLLQYLREVFRPTESAVLTERPSVPASPVVESDCLDAGCSTPNPARRPLGREDLDWIEEAGELDR